ncbi:hypothetical protein F4810DRAFT_330090 [Camillea tinctor]|nr:hypothetical protein F4810DRAFT_330090 [Camillea tinctor]
MEMKIYLLRTSSETKVLKHDTPTPLQTLQKGQSVNEKKKRSWKPKSKDQKLLSFIYLFYFLTFFSFLCSFLVITLGSTPFNQPYLPTNQPTIAHRTQYVRDDGFFFNHYLRESPWKREEERQGILYYWNSERFVAFGAYLLGIGVHSMALRYSLCECRVTVIEKKRKEKKIELGIMR